MGMIVVGISDLKIASPPDTLITYALGSCVGICLLDPVTHAAGLSHIMLPTSQISPNDPNIYKFADTAIPYLVRQLEARGASRSRIKAKIAGGAQMFDAPANSAKDSIWQIGQRNVAAVTEILHRLSIPILAQDVLKNYGRTISFDPATGIVSVRALNKGSYDL